jgi:hypothetical protein
MGGLALSQLTKTTLWTPLLGCLSWRSLRPHIMVSNAKCQWCYWQRCTLATVAEKHDNTHHHLSSNYAFTQWAMQTQWKPTAAYVSAELQTSTEHSKMFQHCTYITIFPAKCLSSHVWEWGKQEVMKPERRNDQVMPVMPRVMSKLWTHGHMGKQPLRWIHTHSNANFQAQIFKHGVGTW